MTKSLALEDLTEVEAWRLNELLRLGFNPIEAKHLLHIPDVAHLAKDMLDRDFPHAVAYWKLRDEACLTSGN